MPKSLSLVCQSVSMYRPVVYWTFLTRVFYICTGDPTVFGNFNVHESANEAIKRQLDTFKHNGYPPAHGKVSSGVLCMYLLNRVE